MAENKDKMIATQGGVPTGAALRRLTRQHFALYRGYLDGVSEAQLHASYGDAGADVRSTRRLIAALRDTLSVLARRAQDTEAAHLLRLRPGSIPPPTDHPAPPAPSLDDFRDRVDPDGVYSESELLTLYEEAFAGAASPASDRRAARNIRLRRRQADALARMEATLVSDPRPNHPIAGWFEPLVAVRLAAAGLVTIADLVALIEKRRHRWFTAVPRLGPKGAQRIVDWLQLHADALQHTLSPSALVPRRQWTAHRPSSFIADPGAPTVVPLEALRVPAALDGSKGTNRSRSQAGRPQTDVAAISAWLEARSASEHTRRAYRREAERLLLWALIERRKPLSSLDAADCAHYFRIFLANPQPAERWVAKGRVERCLAAWRPFAGPLSDRSRETARSILKAMCQWLVQNGYLETNPFLILERAATPAVFDSRTRTLDFEQWKSVFHSVTRPEYTFAEHRDRLALLLAYATGLRRAELAAATTDALSVGRLPGVSAPVLRLSVPQAPGRSARTVLLPPIVVETLRENLEMRGLSDPLDCPEGTPILAQARTGQAITPDGIGKLFKTLFATAAAKSESAARGSGRRLAAASTHWLRHTHSLHAIAQGADIAEIGKGLGHASLATTAVYLETDDMRRLLGVERLVRRTLASGSDSDSA